MKQSSFALRAAHVHWCQCSVCYCVLCHIECWHFFFNLLYCIGRAGGAAEEGRLTRLWKRAGTGRAELDAAGAGDIVSLTVAQTAQNATSPIRVKCRIAWAIGAAELIGNSSVRGRVGLAPRLLCTGRGRRAHRGHGRRARPGRGARAGPHRAAHAQVRPRSRMAAWKCPVARCARCLSGLHAEASRPFGEAAHDLNAHCRCKQGW
jgi:hypothetical protein